MNGSAPVPLLIGMVIFAAGILGLLVLMISWLKGIRKRSRQHRNVPITQSSATPPTHQPPPIHSQKSLPYERRAYLLTRAELLFFDVLRTATPAGMVVFPQMRLASIVDVTARAQRNHTHFNRIKAKCVDFVLCDAQTTAPRLVVELDDSSHDRADRRERDRFVDEVLANAGIPILHVRWQRQYNLEEIRRSIRQSLHIDEGGSVAGWSKPIMGAAPTHLSAATNTPVSTSPVAAAPIAVEVVNVTARYVCGRCQGAVRKDATFCSHCGAVL